MKKIGILAKNMPILINYQNIGEILSSEFILDLIGNEEQEEEIKKIYSIKSYTKIKGKNHLTWLIRDTVNLWHYCQKEKPDILCSLQRPHFQGPLVTIFGKLFKIKTVVRFSGASFDYYKLNKGIKKIITYFSNNLFMRTIVYADKLICMGEEQKRELVKRGCNPDKINILLQPTNPKIFKLPQDRLSVKKELNLSLDKKIILYVGAIVKYKGIDSLLELAKKVNQNYYFILIGDDRDGYKQKFQTITNNVLFLNKMSQHQLVKYYQASDLLVHPSYIEGFPKTVLEATACGLPTIARDIVGVGRVADKVFKTDGELIDLVSFYKPVLHNKNGLPLDFSWNSLSREYLKVFSEI